MLQIAEVMKPIWSVNFFFVFENKLLRFKRQQIIPAIAQNIENNEWTKKKWKLFPVSW